MINQIHQTLFDEEEDFLQFGWDKPAMELFELDADEQVDFRMNFASVDGADKDPATIVASKLSESHRFFNNTVAITPIARGEACESDNEDSNGDCKVDLSAPAQE